jgi:hypothetical protein
VGPLPPCAMGLLKKLRKFLSVDGRPTEHTDVRDEYIGDAKRATALTSSRSQRFGKVTTCEEPYVGWKYFDGKVARVIVPEGATVVQPRTSKKLRTDELYVDEIFEVDDSYTNETDDIVAEGYYSGYIYREGSRYTVERVDESKQARCYADGIYFYAEKKTAVYYA